MRAGRPRSQGSGGGVMSPNGRQPFDLTAPHNLEDPYPLYDRMRREDPVHGSEALHAWVLTRYGDVVAALRNPLLSSQRMDLLVRYQLRHSDPALAKDFERVGNQQMLFRDGAEHRRL